MSAKNTSKNQAAKPPVKVTRVAAKKTAVAKKVTRTVPKAAPKAAPKATQKLAATAQKSPVVGKKVKLVRDSYSMPEVEYAILGAVKKSCLKAGIDIKKSDLLRIGVALVGKLETNALKLALASLTPLKPGRPKGSK
jgi:D-alanyl-D-alanine carboxypeptidase